LEAINHLAIVGGFRSFRCWLGGNSMLNLVVISAEIDPKLV
jgi:hypothetical protein